MLLLVRSVLDAVDILAAETCAEVEAITGEGESVLYLIDHIMPEDRFMQGLKKIRSTHPNARILSIVFKPPYEQEQGAIAADGYLIDGFSAARLAEAIDGLARVN